MKKLTLILSLFAAALVGVMPVSGQQPARVNSTGGNSPHETTSAVIDDNRVTVTYGRPNTKNPKTGEMRTIWGGLVPYGKAWRLGADEATTLVTQKTIVLGGTTLAPGAYTLYMVPEEKGTSKLAISKKVGAWGVPVDEKNDLARVDLKQEVSDKTEHQLRISVVKKKAGGGSLQIIWEDIMYSVDFTVQK